MIKETYIYKTWPNTPKNYGIVPWEYPTEYEIWQFIVEKVGKRQYIKHLQYNSWNGVPNYPKYVPDFYFPADPIECGDYTLNIEILMNEATLC